VVSTLQSAGSAPGTAVAAGQGAEMIAQEVGIRLALLVHSHHEEATRRKASSRPGAVASFVGDSAGAPPPQEIQFGSISGLHGCW
jgi:hypothetical protein